MRAWWLWVATRVGAGEWSRVGHFVTPAFHWAQANDHVEVFVKFAHRMDAPGTSVAAEDLAVKLSARSVTIDAARYSLALDLREQIDVDASSWRHKSRGCLVVLKKRESERWDRLLRRKGKAPRWLERQEALDDDDKILARRERSWLRRYPHACEVCSLAFDAALASEGLEGAAVPTSRSFGFGTLCERATARYPTKSSKGLSADASRACRAIAQNRTFRRNVVDVFPDLRQRGGVVAARRLVCHERICPAQPDGELGACRSLVSAAEGALATRAGRSSRAGARRVVASLCSQSMSSVCARLAEGTAGGDRLVNILRKDAARVPPEFCDSLLARAERRDML